MGVGRGKRAKVKRKKFSKKNSPSKEEEKKSKLSKLSKTGKHEYEQGGGIALEAQDFTDFLHHKEFPSCVLEPGQAMTRVFELRWGVASAAERGGKGEGGGACEAKKATAASNKSAVGAEEMMM